MLLLGRRMSSPGERNRLTQGFGLWLAEHNTWAIIGRRSTVPRRPRRRISHKAQERTSFHEDHLFERIRARARKLCVLLTPDRSGQDSRGRERDGQRRVLQRSRPRPITGRRTVPRRCGRHVREHGRVRSLQQARCDHVRMPLGPAGTKAPSIEPALARRSARM